MQLFTDSKFDFIGRRKIFMVLSIVLILAGLASVAMRGGLKLGIDFKGGTLVYVKFQQSPDVDAIRQALNAASLDVATLQPFEDGNELKIDLNLQPSEQAGLPRRDLHGVLRALVLRDQARPDGQAPILDRHAAPPSCGRHH